MTLFVDEARAEEYICAICLHTYQEPVQISCEEHIYCKNCVYQLVSVYGNSFCCPLCKKACGVDSITRVKTIDRQIRDLQVKCSNATAIKTFIGIDQKEQAEPNTLSQKTTDTDIGRKRRRSFDDNDNEDVDMNINHNKRRKLTENESCEWQGRYSDLNKHIEICPLQSVSCEHCSCSKLRRELDEHYTTCPMFPLDCVKCGDSHIKRAAMPEHISEYCRMTLINCNECKQEILRGNKDCHLENECPEKLIECVFHKFGCRDKLKRKDEKNHIENATFTHTHLVQISNHQLKLENEIKMLKQKMNLLENKQNKCEIDIGVGVRSRMSSNQSINAINAKITQLPQENYTDAHIVFMDDIGNFYRYNTNKKAMEKMKGQLSKH